MPWAPPSTQTVQNGPVSYRCGDHHWSCENFGPATGLIWALRAQSGQKSEFPGTLGLGPSQNGVKKELIRTCWIGANPEKSDLVNFRGPD